MRNASLSLDYKEEEMLRRSVGAARGDGTQAGWVQLVTEMIDQGVLNVQNNLHKSTEEHQHGHARNNPPKCSQNKSCALHDVLESHNRRHETQSTLTQRQQTAAH